jgi:hypothetical protein
MQTTPQLPFSAFAEWWVSPDGDDCAEGTCEARLRTPAEALARASALAAGSSGGEIVITLGEGTYFLDQPLVFDPALFGPGGPKLRIIAAPGACPVLSGAIRVNGWSLHDPALNIHRAHVGHVRSRQLVVNGQRASRARTTMSDGGPPAGFRCAAQLPPFDDPGTPFEVGGGIAYLPTALNPERWRDPASWQRRDRIEAVCDVQWKMTRVPLDGGLSQPMDGAPGLLSLVRRAWNNANVFYGTTPPGARATPAVWGFWQVSWFENAYEFLDQPGEWYLDETAGDLFYIPRPGEDLSQAVVELAVTETLILAHGECGRPVANLSFEGLSFRGATWLGPDGADGYVTDQSGFHLTGDAHRPNITGHARHVVRTPGNLSFAYAHDIAFVGNRFEHLGAVALDFGTGSQRARIVDNRFEDIASAAIQLGGVADVDHHPSHPDDATSDNLIRNNTVLRTGRDYHDAAAIYVGFSRNTRVEHNTIRDTPWSGIALGWGWGLFDPGMFPGIPGATPGMWGTWDTPTINGGNRVVGNLITDFLQRRWDGGAIYCCGQQGQGPDDPLVVEGNVASGKRPDGGGNVFYTDGGSRYILLRDNASFDNPIGSIDMGPAPRPGDPLPTLPALLFALNGIPYGGDIGGCRTYGDIRYENNYWRAGLLPLEEGAIDLAETILTCVACHGRSFDTYSPQGFFNICPFTFDGVSHPTDLVYVDNHDLPLGAAQVPDRILRNAGVREDAGTPAAAGAAPVGGGATFPPRDPGPSWNVPRVSLPGLFGLQPQYGQEWWYYVGVAVDENGTAFGLQIEIGRQAAGSLQIAYGITGIGWRDGENRSRYLSGIGAGLGVDDGDGLLAAMHVAPVNDHAYAARFVPLLEIVGRSDDLLRDLHLNLPFPHRRDGWRFEYLPERSAGAPLGTPGSRYAISAHGRGLIASADEATTQTADYRIALELVDTRGTVMEGRSGYVGPAMFADGGIGLSSYECAQPQLRIRHGGTIEIDGVVHRIVGGNLWLDRQMIAPHTETPEGAAPETGDGEGLRRYLAERAARAEALYLGDWISIVLDDGHALALAEFWQPSSPQWITGTGVGRPPGHGFGNLYRPICGGPGQANGGLGLRPRTSLQDTDWDFDVNLLDTGAPAHSPHWRSPFSGKTYATAWRIDFSPRLAADAGLPPVLYLFAVSDNCEVAPAGAASAFFEGAAWVYEDAERTRPRGLAFVEQMGFD